MSTKAGVMLAAAPANSRNSRRRASRLVAANDLCAMAAKNPTTASMCTSTTGLPRSGKNRASDAASVTCRPTSAPATAI
jgi:hypothetical protein